MENRSERKMTPAKALLVACALAGAITAAAAQDWPTRPITLVVPFAAGGPTDVLGRVLAQRMDELIGQQIVVEDVAGAGGTTGASRLAKAAPDGHHALLGNIATHAYSQTLYKKPPYDAAGDFAPVGLVAGGPPGCWSPARIFRSQRCRNSWPTRRRTRRRCIMAPPASAPAPTSPASCSTWPWAPASPTFPIAAAARRCRTSWEAASIFCAT